MVKELRLNLRSPAARFMSRLVGAGAGKGRRGFGPRLSTAFAERPPPLSPGTAGVIDRSHRPVGRRADGRQPRGVVS